MDFNRIKDLCRNEATFSVQTIGDEMTVKIAVGDLLPITITGTPEELTDGFMDALIEPLEKAVALATGVKVEPKPKATTSEEEELEKIDAEVESKAVDAEVAVVAEVKAEVAPNVELALKPVYVAIERQRWAEALKALNVINAEYEKNETYIKVLAEVEKKSGYDLNIFQE